MTEQSREFPVSWEEIHRHSKALAWRLMDHGPWKAVIAVARGGLVPAVIVARELGIRMVDTVCVSTYNDDGTSHEPQVLKVLPGDGAGCLVIDDMADTGRTYAAIRHYLPKAHYAAVYAKPQGKPFVDSYVMEVSQDTWVRFPWEEPRFPAVSHAP